ncbi:hypothetical protein ACIFOC_02992 [Leucobacter aridicollis]
MNAATPVLEEYTALPFWNFIAAPPLTVMADTGHPQVCTVDSDDTNRSKIPAGTKTCALADVWTIPPFSVRR